MRGSKSQAKRRGFLSANSIFLRQDDAYDRTVSTRNVLILLALLLVSVGVFIAGWMAMRAHISPELEQASVDATGFKYTVDFYPQASIQESHGTNYLVKTDRQGREVTIWVTKIEKVLSCGHNPTFSYVPDSDVRVFGSCYKPDRTVFVADIVKDKEVYQINMTSEAPIDVSDAQEIFKTVSIQ